MSLARAAAKRAAGSPGSREIAFTSSITAAIGVFSANRRPMSSVTFAIVSCALRASGVPVVTSLDRPAASSVTRQSRCRKRTIPSKPESCHSAS